MFRGLSSLNLDPKGRMALPTKYRDALKCSGNLIVTIDPEQRCLLLYPFAQWQVIENKIAEFPSFNAAARRIQRLLVGHATELELDTNGRILLPAVLRDHALLDKKVMLLGQGNRFEIWGEKHWLACREKWLAEPLEISGDLPAELESFSL
ncbi:MAG: transcriptional regulator MraZ [Gammaproteobacteria bacterium]|nr:transcriptional regulator MraZ [Gammaproteobacteria bacterium]